MDAIYPYVKNEDVFNYGSYSYNATYWGSEPIPTTSPRGRSVAELALPASTVWITDGSRSFEVEWPDIASDPQTINENPRRLGAGNRASVAERHQQTASVIFCDGHVKSLKLEVLAKKNANQVMSLFTIEDD
jgi:prepilin-type processing-associated H-X9-DG protein